MTSIFRNKGEKDRERERERERKLNRFPIVNWLYDGTKNIMYDYKD